MTLTELFISLNLTIQMTTYNEEFFIEIKQENKKILYIIYIYLMRFNMFLDCRM